MSGFGVPVVQNVHTQSPLGQASYQNYAGMSAEELQETALRLKGSPQGTIAQHALQQKRMVPSTDDTDAGLPQSYALGGMLRPKGGLRMPERAITMPKPPTAGGFLHTAGPGRTDNLNIKPHADSYVLPADVVSGLGEGNSLAGAKALEGAFHTGPFGTPLSPMHVGHRMGPPRGFAAGGRRAKKVPILAAGGEYVIGPDQVRALGGGDIQRGHEILDAFVLHIRQRTIGEMKKLKGPVKT